MTALACAAAAGLALTLAGCRFDQTLVEPDPHLERMLDQPKRLSFAEDPLLPHGMAMQPPPTGALSTETPLDDPARTTGMAGDRWVDRIPIAIDRPAIEQGRARFDTFCAPCHGRTGDASSVVAEKMALRKPRDLIEPQVIAYPPGKIFATIREGYGMMPSYGAQLPVDDAWEVVAYVQALQLSRHAVVADLPAPVRARLLAEAP